MDKRLLQMLVCPYSGASLVWNAQCGELWCLASKLAYPVDDGIPVMCLERARALSVSECEMLQKGEVV